MKAIAYHQYGGPEVLQIEELEQPAPSDHEVLIKTHATTVTSGDWRVRSMTMPAGLGLVARLMFGITRPRRSVLGSELAGEVAEIGRSVKNFKVGDRVLYMADATLGCSVEYKSVAADGNIVPIPDSLPYVEAVSLPFGGTTAIDFFRRGNLKEGERVLINGASGGVGTMAVQVAKKFGAHVTGVCSTANVELVKSLEADEVVDYKQQDFTQSGERYDIIMDTAATAPFGRCKSVLRKKGRMLVVNGGLYDLLRGPLVALTSDKRVVAGPAEGNLEDLQQLVQWADCGQLKPVIDQTFPLENFADAHRRVDSGRKTGSVVIQWP